MYKFQGNVLNSFLKAADTEKKGKREKEMCIAPLSQEVVGKRKAREEPRRKLFRKVGILENFSALISFLLKKNKPTILFVDSYHKTDYFIMKLKMDFCLGIMCLFLDS